jgi:hypothetical protein
VLMVNDNLRWPALIIFLINRSAAETSHLALSMNSIVQPMKSEVRYKYVYPVPTFTYVSSIRYDAPLIFRYDRILLLISGA